MNVIEWMVAQPRLKKWRPTNGVSDTQRELMDKRIHQIADTLKLTGPMSIDDIAALFECSRTSAARYARVGHEDGKWRREKREVRDVYPYRRMWVVVPL